jgi:hypothetical protein
MGWKIDGNTKRNKSKKDGRGRKDMKVHELWIENNQNDERICKRKRRENAKTSKMKEEIVRFRK